MSCHYCGGSHETRFCPEGNFGLTAPTLTQPEKVGSTDGFGGQPSREELISAIAALIEPRVGSDKKAQLARARQAARKILARTQPPNVRINDGL